MFVRTPSTGNDRSAAVSLAIAHSRFFSGRDHFCDHRIVVNRHLAAFGHARVDADAGQPRFAVEQQPAGLRQKALSRILRVDARFDRVASGADLVLRPGQRLARTRRAAAREPGRRQ